MQIVALILIIVPSLAKSGSYVSSLYIIGGIIACGIFLFIVAVAGLIGAIKHHQVCLFFVSFDNNKIHVCAQATVYRFNQPLSSCNHLGHPYLLYQFYYFYYWKSEPSFTELLYRLLLISIPIEVAMNDLPLKGC